MSHFEIAMLVCFGISWPVSIFKALRTKVVRGKSPAFMGIVFVGYMCGVGHKVLHDLDWVIVLYAINGLWVLVDLGLYVHYSRRSQRA